MTPSRRSGWLGSELDKASVSFALTAAHLAAIDALMTTIGAAGLSFQAVERRHFSHPALDGFLDEVRQELKQGHGLVVLTGFPVETYDIAAMQAIFWGIGAHFGRGCSQSSAGDFLGHVTDRRTSRGYTSNRELSLHCDSTEIAALLCLRGAREGGKNIFASSLKIHEVIRREHAEHLPILERGFRYHRRGEEAPGAEPITPFHVPVFSTQDGVLSCRYSRELIDMALRDLGRQLTPAEQAAIDAFAAVAERPEMLFALQLEPGEAVFMNNFEVLHARTAFVDWDDPARQRLLFRLWLEGEPPRPVRPEIFSYENQSGRQGIDRQEGRVPGLPQYALTNH